MSSLSNAVRELEARRTALETELAKVNARLRAVIQALGASGEAQAAAPATAAPAPKAARPAAKKATVHRWFEQGEALALMRKLIKKPMRPVEVIRALAEAKGYAGKLAKPERDRFNWAVISAIKAAVQAKQLVKHKDGKLSVAR
ncbi:MAG TPA: hypothetical protein VNK91_01440 [Burkholderiaceae bacterium]|jgi:uncharacterized coiled-coil protein SlyX|nr:hypothetical protein [Burkholderiaceae bacterium]